MAKTKPPYAAAFKQQIVELAMAGRTPAELSREFGVAAQSITAWVARAAADAGKRVRGKDVLSTAEREELARLRRQRRGRGARPGDLNGAPPQYDDSDAARIKIEALACAAVAGYLAGGRATPGTRRGVSGTPDGEFAVRAPERIAAMTEIPVYIRLLRMRTARHRDRRWYQVEVVAEVLLERETLNRLELRELLWNA
jgi:transposase